MLKRFVSTLAASLLLVVTIMQIGSGTANAQGVVTAETPTPSSTSLRYAALGDSVAAGVGLGAPDPSDPYPQCGRTGAAYPHAVAAAQGLELTHLACSGATAGDLFTKQSVDGPNIPAQLPQAFAQGTPQVISITAGANDLHWNTFVQKCYVSTCGTASDNRILNSYRLALRAKLHYAFSSIHWRSQGATPQVIVTGYYNPVSPQCVAVVPQLTTDEIAWMSSQLATLNQTLQSISSYYGFSFAPVDFTGHDICSAESWVQGPQDPAPFHPTATGQAAMAQAVLAKF